MIHFENDYSAGAHPAVLQALTDTNLEGNVGYGFDEHTRIAEAQILAECGIDKGSVFFLTGGTQTNAVALDWLCRPGEGVLCTQDAHINVHECGAIETSTHKVIPITSLYGKLAATDLRAYMQAFYEDPTWPHRVRPAAVYISQATELGTLYTLQELTDLRAVCDEHHLALYLDGARLIYALAADGNDLTLKEIAQLTDMFYIGGTKAGTLFGEALVIPDNVDRDRFFSHIKRHGALLAKGWISALQFGVMFTGGLYREIGDHTMRIARRLREGLKSVGLSEVVPSQTNQLFFAMTDSQLDAIKGVAEVDVQSPLPDGRRFVRIVADWAKTPAQVDALVTALKC